MGFGLGIALFIRAVAPRGAQRHLGAVDALDRVADGRGKLDRGVVLRPALDMLGQHHRPALGLGRIAPVLRARHRHLAGGELVEDLGEALRGEILVVILADLRHRRVGAGPETLDLFPRELAVGGDLVCLRRDLVLADRHQILGTADHAGRSAADLHMCHRAHRLQLEHEVEGRDLEHPDIGHVEHLGHGLDRRTAEPALLLLRPPQQRDHRAGLATGGILADLPLGPRHVGLGEGETLGLVGMKAAKHQSDGLLLRVSLPAPGAREGYGGEAGHRAQPALVGAGAGSASTTGASAVGVQLPVVRRNPPTSVDSPAPAAMR